MHRIASVATPAPVERMVPAATVRDHRLREIAIAAPQIGARLLDVPMPEQPLNLVQVAPRAVLPERALVAEVREQQVDLSQPPTGGRAGLAVDPVSRERLARRISGGEGPQQQRIERVVDVDRGIPAPAEDRRRLRVGSARGSRRRNSSQTTARTSSGTCRRAVSTLVASGRPRINALVTPTSAGDTAPSGAGR